MFCSCASSYQDASPNTLVCPVCMGMPGVLPVINREAVRLVISTGLALNCTIAPLTKFDRKNYPYPDLMKGYQISQYDQPIASNGHLEIDVNGSEKTVRVTRVHLEEDVAKLLHRTEDFGEGYSLLDINRAGVPLMEVVSEPDMRSPDEARSYLTQVHSILRYLGVSTANMEEGSFRCDANISVRPEGSTELGAKVEVKNMNSFRSVYRALEFETERQIRASREGERIVQETRGWVDDKGITVSQRSKEYASDYRYFPEPDLPPILIEPSWVRELEQELPELPRARMARLVEQYGLSDYDSALLTTSRETADYFELVVAADGGGKAVEGLAKSAGNWILGEMTRLMNLTGKGIGDVVVEPRHLVELIKMVDDGRLNSNMAKTAFEQMFESGRSPGDIAETAGMTQISDVDSIDLVVSKAIDNNPQPVADYIEGKETALRFLMGQVMKATQGKANPQMVTSLLK
ncbi:MAG: Asp-tRNA(Asn)/Glu-tRNA(Gln) amidotransferase subunit GatB, partial [Chloroflexi bacterium]|nr:Asp-tRNA(Asn)/Glu-tRNA(Gln) amidotransferase subunit GatB [Chloroflexota bacterium]